ncbi:hypothetical protein WA026_006239 [Henosepilachna vigintioctopunctata]|uniref:Cilia- and flagella-associated protein 299 n=1 Tax=Henosepilachna vigintioctopunctata TaxID=420089 RepID=A0AAW1TNB1_9CUCU
MDKSKELTDADRQLIQFSNYEEYLDSFITPADRCYLPNQYICRKFAQFGHRNAGQTYTRDEYKKRYKTVMKIVHPEYIRYVSASEGEVCPDQIHKELAKREYPNRMGHLSTIIFIRYETVNQHEISGYIDYSERLRNENWKAFFQGKKVVLPNNKDLGYYNWKFGKSCTNDSINYKVFTDPYNGLRFQNRFDRIFINVNPNVYPGNNTIRARVISGLYKHIVLFDHIVRQRA